MFPQLSGEERQQVKWHVVGKTGERPAQSTDRQAADGLGSKPGEELPFLDGSLTDAVWWLKKIKGGESAPALVKRAKRNAAEKAHDWTKYTVVNQLKSGNRWSAFGKSNGYI